MMRTSLRPAHRPTPAWSSLDALLSALCQLRLCAWLHACRRARAPRRPPTGKPPHRPGADNNQQTKFNGITPVTINNVPPHLRLPPSRPCYLPLHFLPPSAIP